ncbi:hypothetical protein [Tsukamurella pseudospumae]|uniref:Uncharacterized protein n=1 Tax=Tsukamurella pseudospumae TaxID=239498 RepID=A0A137ZRN3_9ACTN|nr:hypothetical protein [Tsukamurella pseudospumae]KXP00863.1 hypothetical protein AXK61_12705 [Tsukamurella pseudospumae]
MAEVHNQQGDDAATAAGFSRYQFSGKPGDQFEYTPEIGEKRVMTVTVECTAHEEKATANEGIQKIVKLKVVEAEVGSLAAKAPTDPTLFGDPEDAEPRPELGDYVQGVDEDFAPPAADVLPEHEDEGRAPAGMFSDGA